MIAKRSLYSGALGKTAHPGGSRWQTVAMTRDLRAVASVTGTSLMDGEEPIASSLDGLFVLTRTEAALYQLVMWWGAVSGAMSYAGAMSEPASFRNMGQDWANGPMAVGVDWILTLAALTRIFPDGKIRRTQTGIDTSDAYISKRPVILYSPHRNRGFSYGIPGGGWDLFTGEMGTGAVPMASAPSAALVGAAWRGDGALRLSGISPVRVGPLALIDGCAVEAAEDESAWDKDNLTRYSVILGNGVYAVTPVEHLSGGRPVYAPRASVLCASGKLWARGILGMGRAWLIPAAYGEAGHPTEWWLWISDDDTFRSPYRDVSGAFEADPDTGAPLALLTRDEAWEGISPMILHDETDPSIDVLCGYQRIEGDPVRAGPCGLAEGGRLLLPNGTVYDIDTRQRIHYDPTSREALMLDEEGALVFCGDTANGGIIALDDWRCKGLDAWLAPGGQVESVSRDAVASSFENGMTHTEISRGFARSAMTGPPIRASTWGAFEDASGYRSRRAIGVARRKIETAPGELATVWSIETAELGALSDTGATPFDEVPKDAGIVEPWSLDVLHWGYDDTWTFFNGLYCLVASYDLLNKGGYGLYLSKIGRFDPDSGAFETLATGLSDMSFVERDAIISEKIVETRGWLANKGWDVCDQELVEVPDRWRQPDVDINAFALVSPSTERLPPGLYPMPMIYPYPSTGSSHHLSTEEQTSNGIFAIFDGGAHGLIRVEDAATGLSLAWRHQAFGRIVPGSGNAGYIDEGPLSIVRGSVPITEAYRTVAVAKGRRYPLGDFVHMRKAVGDFVTVVTLWGISGYNYGYSSFEDYQDKLSKGIPSPSYLCVMRTTVDYAKLKAIGIPMRDGGGA